MGYFRNSQMFQGAAFRRQEEQLSISEHFSHLSLNLQAAHTAMSSPTEPFPLRLQQEFARRQKSAVKMHLLGAFLGFLSSLELHSC